MSTALVPTGPPVLVPRDDTLESVRALARLMDTAFVVPGTRFRVGMDVFLGLLPVVGDLISAAIGSYIILAAARLGVSRVVLARMFLNLGIDSVVGAVPLAGDLFDAAWKANAKNAALLERALAEPHATRRGSFWVLAGAATVFMTAVAGAAALGYMLARIWL